MGDRVDRLHKGAPHRIVEALIREGLVSSSNGARKASHSLPW